MTYLVQFLKADISDEVWTEAEKNSLSYLVCAKLLH